MKNININKKVLIIDDELDLCVLLKSYLVSRHYDVDMANTLTDGLSKINSFNPDILFLDNNLPDGSGWEKASEITDKYPSIKVNLISGFNPSLPLHNKLTIIEKPLSSSAIDRSLAA
jgi:DNA-binding NtrC family response regulator